MKRVAIVGGGWGGLAAAVAATGAGHQVTLFEATRVLGGRARTLAVPLPDGSGEPGPAGADDGHPASH